MTNYWITQTQIWKNNDNQDDMIDANYNKLMENLYGHTFGDFLAEIGLTQHNATKFLIDALCYVNDNSGKFNT